MSTTAKLSSLKKGEYVQLKDGGPVYVRGEYCRELKKYSLIKFDDISREVFKAGTLKVFVGFTF